MFAAIDAKHTFDVLALLAIADARLLLRRLSGVTTQCIAGTVIVYWTARSDSDRWKQRRSSLLLR